MSNYKASIDIGSNSTLLLIMDVSEKKILAEESRITGLGKNLDKTGCFEESSMEATYDALSVYCDIAESFNINPEDIIVTATEASRVAKNAQEFFKRIRDGLRIRIQTITGEGEAYYTAYGICAMAKSLGQEVVILDVGGASSEFIKIQTNPFKILETISLPIGSVRTTDWLENGLFHSELDKIYAKFDLKNYMNTPILGVAGTLTSLALMIENANEYDADLINNLSVNVQNFQSFVSEKLVDSTSEDFEKYSFLGKRATTIRGGGICCAELLKKVNCPKIMFSTFGLRYGTLLSGGIDGIYLI
ncbi:Ppx/GppA phosphatase [Bacteriovorax sp. Seq25_V]|uniref:Ppx/GppA phosphatase family protein n=1 Tax=Bacteriovorax sp. Seq25_V TaxID=1201288 RepID=UPI000389EDAB|nr:Ppx/GppA phosphatase [Bacteriovorax sp. Seq25_V]EQC43291.1 Ppx/GppA phosphatase family protein [Bacteriovorax sp. Seq25_V]